MKSIDLHKFCVQLREGKLDEQIAELEAIAKEQLDYSHPLKPATVENQHFWGNYNNKVVNLLRELKAHIENGEAAVID